MTLEKRLQCPKCEKPLTGVYMLKSYAGYMFIDEHNEISFANREDQIDADVSETELYDLICIKSGCTYSLRRELNIPDLRLEIPLPKEEIIKRLAPPETEPLPQCVKCGHQLMWRVRNCREAPDYKTTLQCCMCGEVQRVSMHYTKDAPIYLGVLQPPFKGNESDLPNKS
jgi:hypothetical protein